VLRILSALWLSITIFKRYNLEPTYIFNLGNISKMYANLEANVPKFETRKAMVIINMQNDTFEKREDMVVCEPQEFRDTIQAVVPYFRRIGDIVWIRTEFGSADSANGNHGDRHQITDNNEERTANLRLDVPEDDFLSRQIDVDTIGNYYPSSRVKAQMRKASAKARADFRNEELDTFLSDDDQDAYLKKPRKGKSATVYAPGTRGAEFTPDTLANVDEANDLIIVKSHYSAFDATPLLVTLRMKLVTHIYLAGSLSNISIYATAADAVRHGFDVTVVEDCLGYRSEARHIEAMRKMADMLGVSGIDSEEIIEESGGRIPPDADPNMLSGPGMAGIRSRADLSDPVSRTIRDHLRKSNMRTSQAIPMSVLELDRRRSPEDSASPPDMSMMEGIEKSPTPKSMLGPGDHIGEGDSSIILNALTSSLAENAFKLVKDEVDWQVMRHRSGEVPRRVAVQGEVGPNGAVPVYRHPADESPPFLEFTPTIRKIRDELQILLKQPFNHCLIQLYRNGQDNISEHSDKVCVFYAPKQAMADFSYIDLGYCSRVEYYQSQFRSSAYHDSTDEKGSTS
jgi:nicotinamidase-related amidase